MVAMRWMRISLAAFGIIFALSACAPANASGATLLIVSPGSIHAGYQVELRATCADNVNPGYVSSAAFGSVTLEPDHGILMDTVTVPSHMTSGTYNVYLRCASGGSSTAKLTVLNGAKPNPHHGPETGGGEMGSMTSAHLALVGGVGTLASGVGIMILMAVRRRSAVTRG